MFQIGGNVQSKGARNELPEKINRGRIQENEEFQQKERNIRKQI